MQLDKISRLTVKFNGTVVGWLAELKTGNIAFQYNDDWLKNGFSISPFSLPLEKKVFVNNRPDKFNGIFGVFWDSLPDGWGELVVRRMLAQKGINFDRLSPLVKLSIVNRNGLGALEYEPNQALKSANEQLDLDEIAKMAEKILNNAENVDLDCAYKLGGSSGGARPKAHINFEGQEWIVKFPCALDPQNIGEQEFLANKLAKNCGITTNEFRLFESQICSGFFGAKRFDRCGDKKIHTISLSALLETSHKVPSLDYKHLFQVIERICVDQSDKYEAFRRMCFNVFYKNRDDHSKNFAFIYDEKRGGYALSPAYDLTSVPYKPEHEMTVNSNGNPTEADLLALARDFNLSIDKCTAIITNIKHILNVD